MPRLAATKCSLGRDIKGKIIRVVNHVWTWGERTRIGEIASQQNIEGLSPTRSGHARDLPISQDGLRYAVR